MSTDPRRRPPPPPPPGSPPPVESSTPAPAAQVANGQSNPPEAQQNSESFKLKFCTICASNNNRSMEAHLRLTTAPDPYPTLSFGTGSLVRLPGPSITQPNVYNFNVTSYSAMYRELQSKDNRLYTANGILPMLERNLNVKWGPERFQDWAPGYPRVGSHSRFPLPEGQGVAQEEEADYRNDKGHEGTEGGVVDIMITCEERCWEAVVDDLLSRGSPLNRPVHVFNVDIKDNHEEALVGGRAILELANELNGAAREERAVYLQDGGSSDAWENGRGRTSFDERVPDILAAWQDRWPHLPALWTLAWL